MRLFIKIQNVLFLFISCAICYCVLAAQESRITECGHMFHVSCLKKMINYQDTCPTCRQKCFSPDMTQLIFDNQILQNAFNAMNFVNDQH